MNNAFMHLNVTSLAIEFLSPATAMPLICGVLAVGLALSVLIWLLQDRSQSSRQIEPAITRVPVEAPSVDVTPVPPAASDSQISDVLAFENYVLKEFLGEPHVDQALDRLLQRVCPDVDRHWAVFLEVAGNELRVRTSRGLSSATMGRFSTDRALWRELIAQWTGALAGRELQQSGIYRALSAEEQSVCEQVSIIRGHAAGQRECLLVSSMLFDARFPRSQRLAIAEHLVNAAARQLADRQAIESSTTELKLLKAMLELRSMASGEHYSSNEALESMLSGLARLCGFQNAAIYTARGDESAELRVAFRTSRSGEAALECSQTRQEDVVARQGFESRKLSVLDADDLHLLGGDSVLTGAAVVPLTRRDALRGILVFSRSERSHTRAVDRAMLAWAAETLQEVLFSTLDRMTIERQALLDALTGIANRHAFNQELDRTFERLRAGSLTRCSLILIDVDRFKSVNDRYGHLAGDEALKCVATTIDQCVAKTRISDQPLVARFGGEEFAVLLPGLGSEGAERIAESIRVAVREQVVRSGSCEFQVTLSAGVASADGDSTERSLIGAADAALYEAKESGRDQVRQAALRLA